ncbi:MAG TPA: TspO/MBR family protein [Pyrinomonadaceae bacterium]|nr:TspO/MBR family protein [Pyrinomonadaceae bacterium]
MSDACAILISLGVCAVAAALEGVCAGRNVKAFFATLRFPPYSAPLWVWSIIGGLYYVTFCFILYRLLRLGGGSALWRAALTLILFMMVLNALTNYVIFRARNLRLSFIVTILFAFMDTALLVCLIRLDRVAAWALIPYLLYRIYALWWGYGLWKMNRRPA